MTDEELDYALEHDPNGIRDEIITLLRQRDELAEALAAIVDWVESDPHTEMDCALVPKDAFLMRKARSALTALDQEPEG